MNQGFKYCILSIILAYTIPMFGVFINNESYKYIYVLGTHIIGLIIFFIIFNKLYLKN
jgi:hypothetical protein